MVTGLLYEEVVDQLYFLRPRRNFLKSRRTLNMSRFAYVHIHTHETAVPILITKEKALESNESKGRKLENVCSLPFTSPYQMALKMG